MTGFTKTAIVSTLIVAGLSIAATTLLWLSTAAAAIEPEPSAAATVSLEWGLMAAAISTGLSALGAGYAVGVVGSAAVGALVEKPEMLGRLLIFIGLAEGIVIYGLIISILILDRLA